VIRVLVVEDSAVVRQHLVALLRDDPGLEVVGEARDGLEAVTMAARQRPDAILMDGHMPRMDGYEATRRIMEQAPTPIVMVSASIAADEGALSFRALEAGALTIVEKPVGPDHPRHDEIVRQLLQTVRLMAEVKVVRRWPRREPRRSATSKPPASTGAIEVVAIGASTGGPQALAEILGGLPPHFGAPILVVQHIVAGFEAGLATWLAALTPLTVTLAEAGEPLRPATVYIARNGRQIGVTPRREIDLTDEPASDGFRPSASSLFCSVAEIYGPAAAGVLLTGMGRDGAAGLARLRAAGGVTMAQSEQTSVVFGMPAEAIRLDAAEHVLSPGEIAATLRSLVSGNRKDI
jgi:two-component system chemotaxis response regulator CheB